MKKVKNDIQKKSEETFKAHKILTENINLINIKKKELQKKLENVLIDKDKVNQKISEVKVSIEERKEKLRLESAMSGGNLNSIDNFQDADIEKKCSHILDEFIGPKFLEMK